MMMYDCIQGEVVYVKSFVFLSFPVDKRPYSTIMDDRWTTKQCCELTKSQSTQDVIWMSIQRFLNVTDVK